MSAPTSTSRARSTLIAWWPTARALPVGTLAGIAALVVVPVLIVVLRGERGFGNALTVSTLVGAAAMAFAVDDPAAETLQASPTSLARRNALRLGVILVGLAVSWGVVLTVASTLGTVTFAELRLLAAEGAVVSGLALAASALADREGVASPSQIGAVAAPIGVLIVTGLAQRIPELPSLGNPQYHDRWWYVAAVAWGLALYSWRDPAR